MSENERRPLVVYESMYGNTRAIAEAIAEGLGARILPVHEADDATVEGASLLVVGGPTHIHGLASSKSREAAIAAAEEDGIEVEPGARQEPTLRAWLAQLQGGGRPAASFDTRMDKPPLLTGVAAHGIARRLRSRGFDVSGKGESYCVESSEGPLVEGEVERARAWGEQLRSLAGSPSGVAT